jgi:hypothetical protein
MTVAKRRCHSSIDDTTEAKRKIIRQSLDAHQLIGRAT